MTEETDTQTAETSAEASRVRVAYNQDVEKQMLTVKYGAEMIELPAGDELFEKHPDVKDHLALVGLTTYLQRESSRAKDAEKIDAAEKGYEKLLNEGIKAFERKPGGGPRGPRKADKVAALAAIKGATTGAVEKALAKMSKEKQEEILNSKKVLAKLDKMNQSEDELDLAV